MVRITTLPGAPPGTRRTSLALLLTFGIASLSWAQAPVAQNQRQPTPYAPGQPIPVGPRGQPMGVPGGAPATHPAAVPAEATAKSPEAKSVGSEDKTAAKNEDAKPSATVKRPETPPKIADPRELQVVPDEQNRVQFSFHGQPWPEVLQWLANVSNYSLDWQELPGGYLNLTTQRSYSLPEARDLIHSRLRDRGYTMLLNGEILSIAKIEKVDPSLVPRVSEEELYDLQPFDMVKLSFELPLGMEVAATAEDIKKVLSPHAKVLPLPATKRILVIDAVANLRGVSNLLNEERLAVEGKIVPTEIVVKHRRAEKLIDILYVILGLDPVSQPSQMELQVEQQKMQVIQQMAGSGKDVSKMLKEEALPVHIAYNSQRNSLLINAPPEQLRVIERTVKLLDVPTAGELPPDAADGPQIRVARSYKLKSIDPKSLQTTLEEIGDLDPLTELRADNSARILFARATPTDHQKIETLKEQLDSDTMETLVIELRKHPADAVAGTLRDLFAPKKEETSENNQRYESWNPYRSMESQPKEKKPIGDLRVDADVENNRLFVRGSAESLQQVLEFLEKIGEVPRGERRAGRVRVLEPLDPATTEQLLKDLRRTWPALNENELIIRGPQSEVPTAEGPGRETPTVPADRAANSSGPQRFRFAADGTAAEPDPATLKQRVAEEDRAARPAVVVTIDADGRLVLSSDDSEALDSLESLIESSRPPQRRFEVYKVNYVRASSIYLILTGLYKEELTGETPQRSWDWRTDSWVTVGGSDRSAQLSKRKTLKLDYDVNSNTLLVANATPQQQQEIEELIQEYDRPTGDEAKSRRVAAIKIKYSRAKVVAAALKEVYRDLLSQRDKEFETDEKKGASSPKESTTILRFGGTGEEPTDGDRQRPAEIGFQGALSVGVDEISNTIIISAQDDVFDSVVSIIKVLDEEARPDVSVEVRKINGGLSPDALRTALGESLGTPWVGGRPELLGKDSNATEQNGQSPGSQPGQTRPQNGLQPGGPRPAAQGT